MPKDTLTIVGLIIAVVIPLACEIFGSDLKNLRTSLSRRKGTKARSDEVTRLRTVQTARDVLLGLMIYNASLMIFYFLVGSLCWISAVFFSNSLTIAHFKILLIAVVGAFYLVLSVASMLLLFHRRALLAETASVESARPPHR